MTTSLEEARQYIGATYGPQYDNWMALDDTAASKTLVAATRYLTPLPWKGTATGILDGNPTELPWPRSGVIVDGVEIDSLTIPEDVTKATFEMAVLILAKPSIVNQIDQGTNIKRVGGGGAPEVEFFAPTSVLRGTALKLPYVISQLIGKYLASPDADAGGFGQAGDSTSGFGSGDQFTLVLPQ